jgi:hypothetical protein
MTQHPKKSTGTHAHVKPVSVASKMSESVIRIAEPARKVQEETLEMGRKNMENMMHAADDIKHVAAECKVICTDNVGALVESGNAATHLFRNMSNEMVKNSNRTFSELAEISKEAFACRTIHDMVEIQNKTVQLMSDSYFNTTSKLCGLLFDSCNESRELLNERTSKASEQFSKVLEA